MSMMDNLHVVLTVVGFVPILGASADLLNGAFYAAEGKLVDAGLSRDRMQSLLSSVANARLHVDSMNWSY